MTSLHSNCDPIRKRQGITTNLITSVCIPPYCSASRCCYCESFFVPLNHYKIGLLNSFFLKKNGFSPIENHLLYKIRSTHSTVIYLERFMLFLAILACTVCVNKCQKLLLILMKNNVNNRNIIFLRKLMPGVESQIVRKHYRSV